MLDEEAKRSIVTIFQKYIPDFLAVYQFGSRLNPELVRTDSDYDLAFLTEATINGEELFF